MYEMRMEGVKEIRVTVSDGQHERLTEVKGDRTWREAMLEEFGVRDAPTDNGGN